MVAADSLRPLPGRAAWNLCVSGPILVYGAEGQVGREVMALAKAWGIEVAGCNRAQADITNFSAVEAAISSAEPRIVLNAAAYTAVDRAETEKETAYAANVVGGELVARAAAARCLPIIHISTDYVFDGTKIGAYVETDPIAPLGVYGTTKAEGEARVREKNPRHFILRTAWVYGQFGTNFLKTILRLSREREELRIVADQYGCPTATQDLAEAIFAIDRAWVRGFEATGTYHFAGTGVTTWYGFASVIVEARAQVTGQRPKVTPISTADYPTSARRPANSVLDSNLFGTVFGYRARAWQARAQETVEMLLKDSRVQT
jgi:dTDP-4-dehydrorhamnose reductase